jgi:hypothetical protein
LQALPTKFDTDFTLNYCEITGIENVAGGGAILLGEGVVSRKTMLNERFSLRSDCPRR